MIKALYDSFVEAYKPGFGNGARRRVYRAIRSFVTRFYDPAIQMTVAGRELWMPLSHDLPINIAEFPEYSSNIGRIAKLVKEKYGDLHMIDVGANIGDTVAFVYKEVALPILCVEGHQRYMYYLLKNTTGLHDVALAGGLLGDAHSVIQADLYSAHGTARITPGREPLITETLDRVLSRYPAFQSSKLFKIDVDGYDGAVIRGANEYIRNAHPVIFFEYDPHALSENNEIGLDILIRLRDAGYYKILVYDNFGVYVGSGYLAFRDYLEDLNRYIGGRGSKMYYDIAVFHESDFELCEEVRLSEEEYFSS